MSFLTFNHDSIISLALVALKIKYNFLNLANWVGSDVREPPWGWVQQDKETTIC